MFNLQLANTVKCLLWLMGAGGGAGAAPSARAVHAAVWRDNRDPRQKSEKSAMPPSGEKAQPCRGSEDGTGAERKSEG